MDLPQPPQACNPKELIAHLKASSLYATLAPNEKTEHTKHTAASTENSIHQNAVHSTQNGDTFVSVASSISITSESDSRLNL